MFNSFKIKKSMDSKIKIRICVGTSCFVYGGNELKEIKHRLPEDLKSKVYVEASVCLGCDVKGIKPNPPYVEINGYLMEAATIEKITAYLIDLEGSSSQ